MIIWHAQLGMGKPKSFREALGERPCPRPPSWEISVDRPLISGRKQGPVTRSGGWGGIPWALGKGSWGGGKKSRVGYRPRG